MLVVAREPHMCIQLEQVIRLGEKAVMQVGHRQIMGVQLTYSVRRCLDSVKHKEDTRGRCLTLMMETFSHLPLDPSMLFQAMYEAYLISSMRKGGGRSGWATAGGLGAEGGGGGDHGAGRGSGRGRGRRGR